MGENIGHNSGYQDVAAAAVEGWLRSPAHRAEMLDREYSHSGIGVARAADGSFYITQVFVARGGQMVRPLLF